jgi:hypothetical protein
MSFYLQIVGRRSSSLLIAETRIKDYLPRCYTMCLSYWKLRDYECQWKEGIERLRTHPTSCLMLSVWKMQIVFLALYKHKDQVIVAQCMGSDRALPYPETECTRSSCYDFVPPYEPRKYREALTDDAGLLEEWVVALEDILHMPLIPWDKTNRFFLHLLPFNYPAGIGWRIVDTYHIEMAVGEFCSYMSCSLQYWSKEQYERHWKEAFERLKTERMSCCVYSISEKEGEIEVFFMPLYRTKDTVFIERSWGRKGEIKAILKVSSFTPENCYAHLLPSNGRWYPLKDVVYRFVSLKDMLKGLEKSFPLQVSKAGQRLPNQPEDT